MTEIKLNLDNLSDEEIARFFALIERANKPKLGKRKPNVNDGYYYICSDGKINFCYWFNDADDKRRFALGNVFKTEEEAKFAVEKRKVEVLLQDIADELNDGWVPDWSDVKMKKHFIAYSRLAKDFGILSAAMERPGIYFKSKDVAKEAIRRIGEDVLKKYIFEVN